ncbi:hypothetical protein [Pseudocitrobacter faecalis]|uniref:hypothetical protein n=1 Tax=Pseudocitrobacter faecalis TaxID=1398493 RepID=UPI003BA37598
MTEQTTDNFKTLKLQIKPVPGNRHSYAQRGRESNRVNQPILLRIRRWFSKER